jgi:hypothetical protein
MVDEKSDISGSAPKLSLMGLNGFWSLLLASTELFMPLAMLICTLAPLLTPLTVALLALATLLLVPLAYVLPLVWLLLAGCVPRANI